jgi:hypothetical protein
MRAFNRLLSVLLAIAIAVAGVLTVIEIVAAALDKDPVLVKWKGLVDDLSTTAWKTAAPRVAAIVLIVVGLLLLLFALRRGKPATIGLTTSAPDVDMTTTRRSLQRSLGNEAGTVDGIHDASAKVKRRKVVIKARTTSGLPKSEAKDRLTSEVQQRLDALSLADRRRLVVKVSSPPQTDIGEAPRGLDDSDPQSLQSSGGQPGGDQQSGDQQTRVNASSGGSA